MGVCCSKRGEPSFPAKVPSNDALKVKEENESSEAAEFVKAAASLTTKKDACIAERKDEKTGETPQKQSAQLEEVKGGKAVATVPTPLRSSSCTNEDVDAILIQCGRLSRNSSGKTSNETAGQRRHSGSKKSYDFENDGKQEDDASFDKSTTRPSPRRRTRSGSRERGNSEGRRVSRSPGRRSDGPTSSSCDKPRQQPVKLLSVPATEKGALFVNGDTDCGRSAAKRVSATQSTRSRSPANITRTSNEHARSQSLSRCSSKKDESPFRRNPMAEIHENSLRNQNGADITILQKSREVDDMAIQSLITHQGNKAKIVEEAVDAQLNNGVESLDPLTITRTRSSRRASRDLDNNPILKATAYASFILEDTQNHQHNTAVSFPACVSRAYSILDAVNNLNSSCSEQRSYETDQSNNNNFSKGGGLVKKVSVVQRATLTKSKLEVKDDLKKPSISKYVTAIDVAPQESAGSNSFIGELCASSWDLNSVDSTDRCCSPLPCNGEEREVEDEVSQAGNQQQKRSWKEPGGGQRSRASSNGNSHTAANITAGTPLGKKFDHRPLHQSAHGAQYGNGKGDDRAISVRLSAATS